MRVLFDIPSTFFHVVREVGVVQVSRPHTLVLSPLDNWHALTCKKVMFALFDALKLALA